MARLKSFNYAFNGLKIFFLNEHNGRIHLVATLAAIFLAVWLKISTLEWIMICMVIGFVFVAEILNTAIEKLADVVTKETNEKIKIVKDVAAAAVLISALTALLVGLIIFLPKLCLIANP